ncbi:MAG: fibronectin type III domain-containing protein, partial [Syntrophothermus sp.]
TTTLVMTWTIPGYSPNENYNLQVSTRPDFQTFVVNQENITGLSYTLNGLVYGTTYYARIRGRVGTGAYSLFSAIEPFTVISADWLISPIAGSPVEEVQLTSPGAVLSWYTPSASGSNEVRYDLQVSNDAGFTRPQTVNAIIGQSYNLTGLKSDSKYYWRVRSRTENGKISAYSNEGVFVTGKVTTRVNSHNGEVKDYCLKQNYPNPFNPVTTIEFTVKNDGWARLEVIDILGKVIKTLVNEDLQAGTYTVTMNGQGMSSGIYFYKLTTPDRQIINKMILSK